MADTAGHVSPLLNVAWAFWQGFTRPHAGTALGALALTLIGWIFLAASSTEARVRATNTARWLRNAHDDYGRLNAIVIQGAERHIQSPGPTAVFVGASMLQALLPSEHETAAILSKASGRTVQVLNLSAIALAYEEAAAVMDHFGGDFTGWYVVGVNRHSLSRDPRQRHTMKESAAIVLGFDSAVLAAEEALAGLPPNARWGVPLLDHPNFYLRSIGGWKWAFSRPPVYSSQPYIRTQPLLVADVQAELPAHNPIEMARRLGLLGRIAARLRPNSARLVIVECPYADEAMLELHTPIWRAERERFARQRDAWVQAHGVPWLDVTEEIHLRPEDFSDVLHIGSPAARLRFATAVAGRLAEMEP
jgi:hypothetical protein